MALNSMGEDLPEPVPVGESGVHDEGAGAEDWLYAYLLECKRRRREGTKRREFAETLFEQPPEYREMSEADLAAALRVSLSRKLEKLEVLAERGATDGEREAARLGAERVRERIASL